MAYILSIETSSMGCSVALHKQGELISFEENLDPKSSSAMLTSLISKVISQATIEFSNLDAVAVSKGPGSYTGLRIGVSTAKGLCYAIDKPLIAINTLDIIIEKYNSVVDFDFICPMLDARRMEVYCKVNSIKGNAELLETSAIILEGDSFKRFLNEGSVLFCGPGADKLKEKLISQPNANFSEELYSPMATEMGRTAFGNFCDNNFEDLVTFEPYYLKDFMVKKSQKKMPLDINK